MLNSNSPLQPSIAVIIPVYNCEQYLETAVSSVLNQPYSRIRIIIVDDGSTDGSPQLCDRLEETFPDRIHVIHQTNAGVSAARNAAMAYVFSQNSDSYLTFLDADDCWVPNFFDEHIISLLNHGYSLVGFQGCTTNEALTVRSRTSLMRTGVFEGGQMLSGYMSKISAPCFTAQSYWRNMASVFRVANIQKIGFFMRSVYM